MHLFNDFMIEKATVHMIYFMQRLTDSIKTMSSFVGRLNFIGTCVILLIVMRIDGDDTG